MTLHTYIDEYRATPARRRTMKVVVVNFALFAALMLVMFYVRAKSTDWPVPFEFGNLLMVAAMAMSAICASVCMAVGAHSASRSEYEEAVRWVAIAISSWVIFLFLELVEWVRMIFLVELGPKTPFGGTYLALTGSHWLAIVACTIWFSFVIADVRRRDILAAALYSHFLAIWWLMIIVLLYLPNMNPLADL